MKTLVLLMLGLFLSIFPVALRAQGPPSITPRQPSGMTATSAVLTVWANGNGNAPTVWFEWGNSTNYGNVTPGFYWAGIEYTNRLNALSSNAAFFFRAVASNSAGTTYGPVQFFATEGSIYYGSNLRNAIATGGTIALPGSGGVYLAPEVVVTNSVTINANGHHVILDSSGHRLFNVRPATELRLIGLTIQNAAWLTQEAT